MELFTIKLSTIYSTLKRNWQSYNQIVLLSTFDKNINYKKENLFDRAIRLLIRELLQRQTGSNVKNVLRH